MAVKIRIVILSYDAVWSSRWLLTFQRNSSSPTSGQKMEVTGFSKMLVTTYKTTQYSNPEDHNPNDDGYGVFIISFENWISNNFSSPGYLPDPRIMILTVVSM
jgi:hypothetical protein